LVGLQIPKQLSNQVADLRVARGLLKELPKKEGASPMKTGFETIANNELEMVAGGVGSTTNTSSSNDQLLSSVQNIQSSLKDLSSSNQNQGLFNGPNGALAFGMMAMAMNRRQSTTVVYGGRRGGYYWQSSW
jgi:hypothetical protein